MSKYQIQTIQQVMGCSDAEARQLFDRMDAANDHPDWSEFTTQQFRAHFDLVAAGQ